MLKFASSKKQKTFCLVYWGKKGKTAKTEEKLTLYSVKQSCYNKTKSVLPQGTFFRPRL